MSQRQGRDLAKVGSLACRRGRATDNDSALGWLVTAMSKVDSPLTVSAEPDEGTAREELPASADPGAVHESHSMASRAAGASGPAYVEPERREPAEPLARWATVIPPGATLAGRYRIDWFIARGGMGEVYAAYDQELGERIALKTMHSALAGDPEGLAALKAEVLLSRKVSHGNVCRIHDLGVHSVPGYPNLMFLTMEFVDGESLASRLHREGALPERDAVHIACGILAGLAAAHEAGVLHRDLKSDNIMLRRRKGGGVTPVIMDFGLASALNPNSSRISSDQALVGSLGYMAPEQVQGDVLRAVTDVYSLGVILFEMLTGRLPFRASTPALAALKRLHEPAPLVRTIEPSVSPAVERVVERALQARPHDRYRSALAMLHDLETLSSYRRITPIPLVSDEPGGDKAGSGQALAPPSTSDPRQAALSEVPAQSLGGLISDFDAVLQAVVEPAHSVVPAAPPTPPAERLTVREPETREIDVTLRSARGVLEAARAEAEARQAPSSTIVVSSEHGSNTSLPTFAATSPSSKPPTQRFGLTFALVTMGVVLGGLSWLTATSGRKPGGDSHAVGRVSIGAGAEPMSAERPGMAPMEQAPVPREPGPLPHGPAVASTNATAFSEPTSVSSGGAAPDASSVNSDASAAARVNATSVRRDVPEGSGGAPRVYRAVVAGPEVSKGALEASTPEPEPAPTAEAVPAAPLNQPVKRPTIVYPPELRPQSSVQPHGEAWGNGAFHSGE